MFLDICPTLPILTSFLLGHLSKVNDPPTRGKVPVGVEILPVEIRKQDCLAPWISLGRCHRYLGFQEKPLAEWFKALE